MKPNRQEKNKEGQRRENVLGEVNRTKESKTERRNQRIVFLSRRWDCFAFPKRKCSHSQRSPRVLRPESFNAFLFILSFSIKKEADISIRGKIEDIKRKSF